MTLHKQSDIYMGLDPNDPPATNMPMSLRYAIGTSLSQEHVGSQKQLLGSILAVV
jgi:hypothetical protein